MPNVQLRSNLNSQPIVETETSNNFFIAFSYSIGFAVGTYLGGILSNKLINTKLSLQIILNKKDELAKNLPYGEQRKLEIVRALASSPKLLLLDEPAAGMNPQETEELMNLIAFIRKEFNLTILLIEHDMKLVMGICEKLMVLDYGKVIASGKPEEIKTNPQVMKAYLGSEAVDA